MHPPPTCQNNRVGRFRPSTGGRLVGRSHRSTKTTRKRWKKHRFDEETQIPTIVFQIPVRFPLNLMRFRQIQRKSHQVWWDFAKFGQNLTRSKGNITRIWVSSPDSGKLSLRSRNFGRNLEIFWLVRVLGEENQNRIVEIGFWWWRPTGAIELAEFGLDLVGSSGGSGYLINLDSPN